MTEILRKGAHQLLRAAVEAELDEFLSSIGQAVVQRLRLDRGTGTYTPQSSAYFIFMDTRWDR